jgi:hypothetical protein
MTGFCPKAGRPRFLCDTILELVMPTYYNKKNSRGGQLSSLHLSYYENFLIGRCITRIFRWKYSSVTSDGLCGTGVTPAREFPKKAKYLQCGAFRGKDSLPPHCSVTVTSVAASERHALAPNRSLTRVAKADSISLGLLALRITTRASRTRAASCTTALSVAVWGMLAGLRAETGIKTISAVHSQCLSCVMKRPFSQVSRWSALVQ